MNITIEERTAIPTLMHWRKEVIENVFGVIPSKALLVANRRYYNTHIADGTHIAIVAFIDGADAGCGAICLTDELPSPDNPSGRCAYLMNIYVRREYRRHGIAHAIVRWLVEKAQSLGCDKIYLETTDGAKPVYTEIGFVDLPNIMKYAEIHDR
ncbi:MAG: GNAT family N-acetyltransferase [Muribaculaceae bacterium]